MDQSQTNSLEKTIDAYNLVLRTLQNWILTINAGGLVALLSYIATNAGLVDAMVLTSLIAFCLGLLCGLLWTFTNFAAYALVTYRTYKNLMETGTINISPYNIKAQFISTCIFGIFSAVFLVIGMSCGYSSLAGYSCRTTFYFTIIVLFTIVCLVSAVLYSLNRK